MMLVGVSLALFIPGVFGLYAHLSQTKQQKVASAGLVVVVGFLVLFLPVTGFAAFVVPAIGALAEQGHVEMVAVMDQTFKEPFLAIQFFAGILWNNGHIAAIRTLVDQMSSWQQLGLIPPPRDVRMQKGDL
jgi:predicted permease